MIELWDHGGRESEWHPLGAVAQRGNPEIGALVAVDHAVYRVREIRPKPGVDWDEQAVEYVKHYGTKAAPVNVIVRPARIAGDDPKLRGKDIHLRAYSQLTRWWVYPHEHYPICSGCGEPMPCRETLAIEASARAAKFMGRYELPGVCPACGSPVTKRQGFRTFDENLYVPLGPPVTFHAGRRACWDGLVDYEEAWVKVDPENRKRRYRCDGTLTTHSTTEYECTQGVECPGPQASHRAVSGCRCPWHKSACYVLARDALSVALEPQGGEVA